MRLLLIPSLTLVLALPLAGCDNRPNPTFEQSIEEAKGKQTGDRFTNLSQYQGRLNRVLQADAEQRAYYITSYSSGAPSVVSSALSTLEELGTPAGGERVAADCRAAVEAALAFKTSPASTGPATSADAVTARLAQCRAAAMDSESKASDEDAKVVYNGWRRTASAAMMVVGSTLMERGETDHGTTLWREADRLMAADRPAFKVKLNQLGRNG
jgi:hypothetical protein